MDTDARASVAQAIVIGAEHGGSCRICWDLSGDGCAEERGRSPSPGAGEDHAIAGAKLPDEIIALLHRSDRPLAEVAQELIVLELYRQGLISSGKAAELLDMGRWDFVRYASRLGIPFFDMTEDEWAAEVAQIDRLSSTAARGTGCPGSHRPVESRKG